MRVYPFQCVQCVAEHECHDQHNTMVPYWLATGGWPLCFALQKPLRIRGGSSSTEAQPCCAFPDRQKMRAGRMRIWMCVWVCVCNRGREVKGEGCTVKRRRVKWKEKAISPLSQLTRTPFFCLAEGDTFYFLHLPLFLPPSLSCTPHFYPTLPATWVLCLPPLRPSF